ncbi:hypothetical protein M404DRAFT_35877 [Pisolithus tinctorius Marx 270]|uniref:Uncharacterized protein n=1 Tax=Pisolithus tinctorius Marx 270 TaxID=870435 RepID=A0A0C3NCU8_PISTI|nr:hypothetical protein M404DRAFT_35877 [Pisolithus tinctorius Marx 270]
MATGVSLQESYLRGRGNERSGLRVPAVSRNMHQLTNDPFRSKIPLEFEAERLKEHPKPTGVEVEGLETLTGSPETDRLAYKEATDSHREPQHMNHIESKVIARRIQIKEPSRLVIRRKPLDEVLRIVYILFENPLRESTRTLGVRTCAESPAMLTKRSHVTALRVVAARTQVTLHTDDSRVIDRLRKITAIEEYEEWGEWRTVWKLPRLRAMATAARTTMVATRVTATTTTTLLSADKQPYEVGGAVRWERCAMSVDTELDGSEVRFDFETLYLHLCYSREGSYLRRTATAVPRTAMTMTTPGTDRRPHEARTAVRWEQGATSTSTGLDGPRFRLHSIAIYLQILYSREDGYTQQRTSDIQRIGMQRTTTTRLSADQRTYKIGYAVRWKWGATSAGSGLYSPRFCFDSVMLYLQLFYSRDSGWLRRNATDILAIATQDSMASYERAIVVLTQARVMATVALDADQRPHEEKIVIRWRRGATSADTEHYGLRFHFEFRAFYLQSFYSREVGYLRRRARATTTRVTATTTTFNTDQRPYEAGTAVQWTWSAMEVTELECSRFRFDSKTFYFQLLYSRKNRCARRCWSDIQAIAGRGSTKIYAEIQWTIGEKLCQAIQRCYYEWGKWIEQAKGSRIEYGLATATATVTTRTTTALDSERQPCEARMAVRRKRGYFTYIFIVLGKPTINDEQRSQFKNLRRSTNKGREEVQQDDRKDYSSVFDSDHQGCEV